MNYIITLKRENGKKIYIDPEEAQGLYLYPGEVKKLHLEDGMEISQERLEQIREEYSIPRAKKRALGILTKGDRTEKDLEEKLVSSLHDPISIAAAMAFIKGHGYVDDYRYAKDYISFKKSRKSFRQIREELQRKGIPEDILSTVFEEEGEQDFEDICNLVEKYSRKFKVLDAVSKQKIFMHFARKGYRMEQLRSVLNEVEQMREE